MHATHKIDDALIMCHTQTQTKSGWLQTFVIPNSSVKVLQICTHDKVQDCTMSCLSCFFVRRQYRNGKQYGVIDKDHFDIH
ncbi:hypothetical protein [Motilimonas pumila]|uniref:Uncharacterized protein n=1 Tax=Motilimonas pumila TaxID=2303987 RepID=A0A418YFS7_9GAMM|nr:hypothetical protein [Motilimonas pumila]RJG48188.1 hypothetical protein D1Z90_08970 [Motilimonas pumila]